MAVAVRSISGSTTNAATTGANSLATAAPSGKSTGDLLVLIVSNRSNIGLGVPALGTGSAGWSAASPFSSASVTATGTSGISTKWWWRVADGSANDTPTVTGSFTSGDDGNISYSLLALTGALNSGPGDVGAASTASSGANVLPTITTTQAADLQIGCWGSYDSTGNNLATFGAVPSGWTFSGSTANATLGNINGGQYVAYRTIASASTVTGASVSHSTVAQQTMTTVAIKIAVTSVITNKIGWGTSII